VTAVNSCFTCHDSREPLQPLAAKATSSVGCVAVSVPRIKVIGSNSNDVIFGRSDNDLPIGGGVTIGYLDAYQGMLMA
jgi:hypothetical protein